jgi:hypothetical protein
MNKFLVIKMTNEREYLDTCEDEELKARMKELTEAVRELQRDIDIYDAEIKLIYNVMFNRRRARFLDDFEESEPDRLPRTYTNYL